MSTSNKMFQKIKTFNDHNFVSRIKVNREYLLSKADAEELNTYVSFVPFPTFNDGYESKYDENGQEIFDNNTKVGAPGVRSLFNKTGAVIIGGTPLDSSKESTKKIITNSASEWRISNNVPLMDNRSTRLAIRQDSGCSIKELVNASQNGLLGREIYSFSDFMYCKHLGKISNNYLITLRRFPYPVDDYISTVGVGESKKEASSNNVDSIGCLVTWMGTPGNEMYNLLKYSVAMPFKEQKAQLQDQTIDADSGGGPANAIASVFDPKYRQQYMDSQAGDVVNKYIFKNFPMGDKAYPARDYQQFQDQTKIYGPVDVIKTTYMRSDEGLDFKQSISITFDYELRSYNGINGRQAMLDLLSNILNVTYSTGTFWGGGYRTLGAHQNNIFNNLQIYKKNSSFTDFLDSFSKDAKTITDSVKSHIQSNGGIIETFKSLANQLGGMLLAGFLNKAGRPQKALVSSLLSPAPIGFWHLTIGNPHHPIMSIGNLILKNTTIEHYGPLGLDDFPTGLKVTCELERGKSRDIRDIEKLYMHGNDRIYSPMGPKIFDMYENSKEYNKSNWGTSGKPTKIVGNANTTVSVGDGNSVNINDISSMKYVLQKYFGRADTTSIMIASMEQEMGAHKKKKKGTAGGDSSAQGNK